MYDREKRLQHNEKIRQANKARNVVNETRVRPVMTTVVMNGYKPDGIGEVPQAQKTKELPC